MSEAGLPLEKNRCGHRKRVSPSPGSPTLGITYWEPAKWTAKLRATRTDNNLLLLKTHMDSGHAGAAGRFDSLKEVALVYAFGLLVCGLADGSV